MTNNIELSRFENIPQELRDRPQWVCWKYVERDGRRTKPPFQVTGEPASATNPTTWNTFENVVAAVRCGDAEGIGFVFTEDDPYVGVDLDKCMEDGKLRPWTELQRRSLPDGFSEPSELVKRFGAYAEVSPSGKGLKMICRGELPGRGRHVGDFEIYDQDRYFTVTGQVIGTATISEATEAIAEVYDLLPTQESNVDDLDWKTSEHPEGATDDQVIRLLRRDLDREQLWLGEWEADYESQSNADLALCSYLAFFAGPYPKIVARLFAQSGLYREKWERTDYVQSTVAKAIVDKADFYTWRPGSSDAPQRPKPTAGRIRVVSASDVKPEKLTWLWPGHIPAGVICEITGNAGLGKSQLTIDLAARVSRGDLMPFEQGESNREPSTVLMICAEDSYSQIILPRWEAANGEMDRLKLMSEVDSTLSDQASRPIFLQTDLSSLEELVEEHDAKLLIIDPYTGFIDDHLNLNSDPDNRQILGPLAQMAERKGLTVLLVRHLNKKEGASAIHRAGGSVAITAASRASFVVAEDKESRELRAMACTKMNAARMPRAVRFEIEDLGHTSRIVWRDEFDITADQLLDNSQGGTPSQLDRATGILKASLAEGPMAVAELKQIVSEADIGERTYQNACKALQVVQDRSGFGGKFIASLPDSSTGDGDAQDAA